MARPKKGKKIVRKLTKVGGGYSYSVILPAHIVRQWGWREHQKLTLEIDSKKKVISIKDWKK